MKRVLETPVKRLRALMQRAAAALALAATLLASLAGPAVSGTLQAQLNINVNVNGLALVTDLGAAAGGAPGTISLTWTEPRRSGGTLPFSYDVRASTLAQINTAADFAAALPLSTFSPTAAPAPGLGGGAAGFVVASLTPGVTYFFALTETDSSLPALTGSWLRGTPKNWNALNSAAAQFVPNAPNAVTDLVAIATGSAVAPVAKLTWTAPLNVNGVPVTRYLIKYSTVSATSFGNGETWFAQAPSTSVVISSAQAPGSLESLNITGLPSGPLFYFGVKSYDFQNEVAPVDTRTAGLAAQARTNLVAGIDVHAAPGAASGSVSLTWTEPAASVFNPPIHYQVAISSVANFNDNAGFNAAQPLTALSASVPPNPGAGGATATFLVTGLTPGVTFFFGIREIDSAPTPNSTNWVRDLSIPISSANFAAAAFQTGQPSPITDLTALAGAVEGQLTLSWTAPGALNFAPVGHYLVKYGPTSIASLAGDTTAFFTTAPSSETVTGQLPGTRVTLNLNGLFPLTTFYFAVKSVDTFGEISLIDARASGGTQAFAMPENDPPAAVSSMTAAGGFRRAALGWAALTPAEKGLDFAFYRLWRSTDPVNSFVLVTTTTATSYLDRPIVSATTFYYKVQGSEGPGGLNGAFSSTATAVAFTLAPQDPFGFTVTPASSTVSFKWAPTVRFADGTIFTSTGAPVADELLGYRILRSTDICASTFTWISSTTVSVTTFSDVTNGNSYLYQIHAFNSLGQSTSTLVLSTLGDQHYFVDDCNSQVVIDQNTAYSLSKSSNGLGADILISRSRRPQDVGDDVMQSVEFRPMLDGVTELKGFYLPKPARIQLHYQTGAGGAPTPDTRPTSLSVAGAQTAAASLGFARPTAGGDSNLGAFWNNGQAFQKMYGQVDPLAQTVNVLSPNLGVYQVRAMLRSDSAVFDLSNISGRVITPNGDGKNDQVIFTYDPGPRNVTPEGKIYDMHGSFVTMMTPGLVPNTLTWDGRMNGRVVTSGVYVYQIKGDGKAFSGTIVVAR